MEYYVVQSVPKKPGIQNKLHITCYIFYVGLTELTYSAKGNPYKIRASKKFDS